jgi:Polyketide cyclase / dehydrase and lipid transport
VEEPELRYADGPTTMAELHVAAPPAVVWPFVCDIQTPARFSTEFQGGELLGDAPAAALGVQFRGHNHHPSRGEWSTVSTVCEYEPGQLFGWAVGDPDRPAARWRFTLAADGDGTRITQWAQLGPGESGISELIAQMPDKESRILQRRLAEHHANMVATLEGIKGLAEASVS